MRHLLIALTATVALGLSGCKASDIPLNPADQARVEHLEQEIEAKDAELASWKGVAGDRLEAARQAVKRADQAEFGRQVSEMEVALENYELAHDQREELVVEQDGIYNAAVEEGSAGFLGLVAPFIPLPIQPFVPLAIPLLGFLFRDRSRKHFVAGAKSAMRLQFGETLLSLRRSVGWDHSTAASKAVADAEMNGGAATAQPEAPAPPA